MASSSIVSVLVLCAIYICCVQAKIYETKTGNGYVENRWNTRYNTSTGDVYQADSSNDRTERLGTYSTGYGSVSGYPHSGSGVGGYYSPLKFNIGALVVGTMIGVGVLLLIPKLANAFHGGNGGGYGNYRSIDGDSNDLTTLMHSISNFLDDNQVDSGACFKRMVCSSVRNSEFNIENKSADQIDQFIYGLADNSFVKYMVNGTQINEALENGRNRDGKECNDIYKECTIDKELVLKMFKNVI